MCVCVCVSQGTFSSFYYFKHRDQYIFIFKCTNLKVVSHITLIVLVIGKAQFRRAMLSCDSSCILLCTIATFQKAGTCLEAQQSMEKQPIKGCVSNHSRTCRKSVSEKSE